MTRILKPLINGTMDPRNVPEDAYLPVMRRYYEIAESRKRDPSEGIDARDFEEAVLQIAAEREKERAEITSSRGANE